MSKFYIYSIFSCFILLFNLGSVYAQTELHPDKGIIGNSSTPIRCYTVEADSIRRAQDPSLPTLEEEENWLQEQIAIFKDQQNARVAQGQPKNTLLTLPIVFHVITSGTGATNVAASRIQAQVDQLNIDYRNLAGSTNAAAGDCEINFCLALRDPSDNVLTEPGINRVTTYGGGSQTQSTMDNTIKPATIWDPTKYINIWVVNLGGGLLGYAQFPSNSTLAGLNTNGGAATTDGVVILYTSLGSVASPNTAGGVYGLGRTLTHELGHYLGLRHIWGDGNCSATDYCADTPPAGAANYGCPTGTNSCTTDAFVDMIQNYMDYTDDGCMNILTNDQVTRVRTVLSVASRRATIASSDKCTPLTTNNPPVADFSANNVAPCIGATVTFTDASTNTPTSWSWSITPSTYIYTGGTSATSQNPKVIFNASGAYTIALTATNAYGSNTNTKTAYINPTTSISLPVTENFEGTTFPPTNWSLENADAGAVAWGTEGAKGLVRRTAAGNTGSASGCAGIEFFNYNTDTSQVDNIISVPINLAGASEPKLTFKRSYKYYTSTTAPTKYRDELKVYVSTDCGTTWGSALYFKKGVALATSGTSNATFSPAVEADWDIDTINLSAYIGQSIKVKFELGNRWGNNLYIDDVNIASSAAAVASVAITSSDTDNSICSGSSVTFTATATNGGTAPTYQWQVNGSNVGTNSSTLTTTSLTNGQVVTCIMTSNLSGVTGSPATSNGITTTVNTTPTTPTPASNSPICAGSAINLTTSTVSGATYSWTGPNGFTSSSQNPTLSASTTAMGGTYSLIVSANGCSSAAGTANVTVSNSVTPAVSSAVTAGSNPTCTGQAITFTATPTNGGTSPTYQWQVNGTNVGTNSPTFSSSSLTNGQVVTCIMSPNSSCASPSSATSTAITISVASSFVPGVQVSLSSGSNPSCSGEAITFDAAATNGGSTPTYQWQVNGNTVGTGPTYSSSSLANGSIVTCILTSSLSCASPATANSNSTTLSINQNVTPSVVSAITAGSNPSCTGQPVTFTATPTNGGTSPSYQWQVNGNNVGTNSPTYSSSSLTNGQVVTCVMTSNAACASPSTSTSSGIAMQISSVTPAVSTTITAGSNPICAGSPVSFSANATNGGTAPSYQWYVNGIAVSGATTTFYSSSNLVNGDVVTCSLTSNESCVTTSTVNSIGITMTVNQIPGTPVITQNGLVLTSSAPTGNQWYLNGVAIAGATSQSYTATQNGNYTVVVSNSGCTSPASANSIVSTVGINEAVNNGTSFVIYPNPNNGKFTVVFSTTEIMHYTITLHNAIGQVIYEEELKDFTGYFTKNFDVIDLGKGEYFLTIENSKHQRMEKVIVY